MNKKKEILIVESPTKAKTISRLLKDRMLVLSSQGHIKDLPKTGLGVDLENSFEPTYDRLPKKIKIIRELRRSAKDAETIYLGCDPDREGEAIAYHIAEELKNGREIKRVLFYEITPKGIESAFHNPTEIDLNKVNSHKARRVLDRLVGYLTSPLLWRIFRQSTLSAGRVQTVALRLICEREKERENFVPEEYWLIKVIFKKQTKEEFEALLFQIDEQEAKIENEKQAKEITNELESKIRYYVTDIQIKKVAKSPEPPFITATVQQEAAKRLAFSPKKTMVLAQQLFEGIELKDETIGLITYPRTDSVRVAEDFINQTREYIKNHFGIEYLPENPKKYRDKRLVQGAHEAIRPTAIERQPETIKKYLTPDQYKLYDLIYRRFLASQTKNAVFQITNVLITGGKYKFKAGAQRLIFDGFYKVLGQEEKEQVLPKLTVEEELFLTKINPEQHFTQPPTQYSESSLIKKLEINGIGRPSTYALIVSTLLDRKYLKKISGKLVPTQLGRLVNDVLIPRFSNVFEVGFTKKMETELDMIETGKEEWRKVVKEFYEPFNEDLANAEKDLGGRILEERCPECGKQLVLKLGKFGEFIACSDYPQCRYIKKETRPKPVLLDEKCPECGRALQEKSGRFGKFIACSGFPDCKYIKKEPKPESVFLDEKCPECGRALQEKSGRFGKFIACSGFPDCRYTKRPKIKK